MNKFADRLRHARLLRNLTQAQLAKACGLSQGAIANYEGKSRQSAKEIFKLADALNVNAQWLSQGSGPMEPADPTAAEFSRQPTPNAAAWPFQDISPDEYWSLSGENRTVVENTITALMSSLLKKPPAD